MAITTPAGSSRRDFIRLTGTLGMAAGLAVSLAACGGKGKTSGGAKASGMAADQEVTHKDGVITAGISYELGTNGYDPMTTSSALTVAANWHTLEGLTELHPATLPPGRDDGVGHDHRGLPAGRHPLRLPGREPGRHRPGWQHPQRPRRRQR